MSQSRESAGDRTSSEASYATDAVTPLVAIVLALGGWRARLPRPRVEPRAAPTERDLSPAA